VTVSTTASSVVCIGNGVTTVFTYSFVNVLASDIQVTYTNASGTSVLLSPSQYTLVLGNTYTDDGFAIGGTVTYPIVGSPIANGTSLTIARVLPLTQNISISNQGNFYPQTIEQALDIGTMQLQQVSNRTTQFRGIWITDTSYSVGDIVQDGPNGKDTLNYYICQTANTSGVWVTDLASGYWAISVIAAVPSTNLPITLSGAVTGTGTTAITTAFGTQAANTVLANATGGTATVTAVALTASTVLGRASSGNISAIPFSTFLSQGLLNMQVFTSSGTYTPTTGTSAILVIAQGGGGGGGGTGGSGVSNGGTGGTTSFGALLVCGGGTGGVAGTNTATGSGGAGGTTSAGTLQLAGSAGGASTIGGGSGNGVGGNGGAGFFGTGAGSGGCDGITSGTAAGTNTGAGGGGSSPPTSTYYAGGGGGAGGFGMYFTSSVSSQTVTIGAAGAAGPNGSGGFAGSAGGSGVLIILEFT
jgi:hypothetical protein